MNEDFGRTVKPKEILKIAAAAGVIAAALSFYNELVLVHGTIKKLIGHNFGIGITTIVLFCIAFVIIQVAVLLGRDRIFRYRYLLAFTAFILLVSFGITGSSIGCYSGDAGNVLLGTSRGIRSDEWAVFTPMTWSQYLDPKGAFSYYSSILRAGNTDVFIEYGQPVKTWLMIYRPFQIGYLFLPIAKGMSFFWIGRLIALFMVSFEFGRLITDENRQMAVIYAVMVTFAPGLQWWFAINGFAEMLITFQLSIVIFDKYLSDANLRNRILYAAVIVICAGTYALTMYPAWMVPLAYVLLSCAVWVVYRYIKKDTKRKLDIKDALIPAGAVIILACTGLYVFSRSGETIQIIMNTVYPGKRDCLGGGDGLEHTFDYISNIWYVIRDNSPYENACEASNFISLFPMGYLIYGRYIYRERKSDLLCTLLCAVSLFLLLYCDIGFSPALAKITLMNRSAQNRAMTIFGLANTILLIRSTALNLQSSKKDERGKVLLPAVAAAIAIAGVLLMYRSNPDYYNGIMILSEVLVFVALFCGTVMTDHIPVRKVWAVLMIAVCLESGLLVNPVRAGASDIEQLPELMMAEEIVKVDPNAVWIAEDFIFPTANMLMMKGARVLNCTNVYPDMERWAMIDKTGEYEECYNRYAHIGVIITDEVTPEKFVLEQADCFKVYLNEEDLGKLGIDYILSPNDLAEFDSLKPIKTNNGLTVYKYEG